MPPLSTLAPDSLANLHWTEVGFAANYLASDTRGMVAATSSVSPTLIGALAGVVVLVLVLALLRRRRRSAQQRAALAVTQKAEENRFNHPIPAAPVPPPAAPTESATVHESPSVQIDPASGNGVTDSEQPSSVPHASEESGASSELAVAANSVPFDTPTSAPEDLVPLVAAEPADDLSTHEQQPAVQPLNGRSDMMPSDRSGAVSGSSAGSPQREPTYMYGQGWDVGSPADAGSNGTLVNGAASHAMTTGPGQRIGRAVAAGSYAPETAVAQHDSPPGGGSNDPELSQDMPEPVTYTPPSYGQSWEDTSGSTLGAPPSEKPPIVASEAEERTAAGGGALPGEARGHLAEARNMARSLDETLRAISGLLESEEAHNRQLAERVRMLEESSANLDAFRRSLSQRASSATPISDLPVLQHMLAALIEKPNDLLVLVKLSEHAQRLAVVVEEYAELRRAIDTP